MIRLGCVLGGSVFGVGCIVGIASRGMSCSLQNSSDEWLTCGAVLVGCLG